MHDLVTAEGDTYRRADLNQLLWSH